VLQELRAKAKPEYFFKKSMGEEELFRKSVSPQALKSKGGPTAPHAN
jgi:hypothetical protein